MMKIIQNKYRFCFGLLIIFINLSGYNGLYGQVVLKVKPPQTDSSITTIHGPHLALYDQCVASRKKLVLMISGTGGAAQGYIAFEKAASAMGYHVIGLDYNNKVITTICVHSGDSTCYDNYRQEIDFGTPVSEKVYVDSVNSLVNRFQKLLQYLVKKDPYGGWNYFMKGSHIKWNKVIVAGHSQGAGHAGYLGEHFKTARVLIFSGPQDYFASFNKPALWLSNKGKTPPGRYFAFLHKNDPFQEKWQLASVMKLRHTSLPDTLHVKSGIPIHSNKHILLTDIRTKDPHGSTVRPIFKNVWRYMLEERDKKK